MSDTQNESYEVTRNVDIELKSSDIAGRLKIAESTVRKYAGALAKQGYQFRKTTQGGRIYTEKDLHTFQELLKLRSEAGISLEQAAIISATRNASQKKSEIQMTQGVHPPSEQQSQALTNALQNVEKMAEQMSSALEKIDDLQQENQELKDEMQQIRQQQQQEWRQQTNFNHRLERVLNEREQKRGFWQRIFNK